MCFFHYRIFFSSFYIGLNLDSSVSPRISSICNSSRIPEFPSLILQVGISPIIPIPSFIITFILPSIIILILIIVDSSFVYSLPIKSSFPKIPKLPESWSIFFRLNYSLKSHFLKYFWGHLNPCCLGDSLYYIVYRNSLISNLRFCLRKG